MYQKLIFLVTLLILLQQIQQYETANETLPLTRGFFDFFLGIDTDCDCKCGIPNREARLVGGEYLRGYEFPWLALIQIRSTIAVPGTLINNKYVITSTSQLVGLTPYDLKVTVGQFDRCFPDVSSQNLSVDAVILHPDFSPGNRAHDIALVKLSSPVHLERRIHPICLSTPGSLYTGQVATVVAWSDHLIAAPSTPPAVDLAGTCRPRKLGLPVLGYTECLGTAFNSQYTSLDKGCIGIVGSRSVVCATDAGGPVMYRSYGGVYELIGILTDQNDCGDLPSTALYTKINDHLKWIKDSTRDACYCLKT